MTPPPYLTWMGAVLLVPLLWLGLILFSLFMLFYIPAIPFMLYFDAKKELDKVKGKS